ncbi:trypco2 family protein [Endothiovibrio diazotrophicus]
MDEKRLELATMIGALRAELNRAQKEGAGEAIRFTVEEVELELDIQTVQQGEGKVGAKFFVVTSEVKGSVSDALTQKIRLKLKPKSADDHGGDPNAPLDVDAVIDE